MTPVFVGGARTTEVQAPPTLELNHVLVGLIGENNGTMTFNLSTHCALYLSGKLLGEEQHELNEEILDAIGEIGKMIAGSIKDRLVGTDLAFDSISCPAIVMGPAYNLYYYRGFTAVSVECELPEIPAVKMNDRFFAVSVSLMKG